ncbi:transcriptional repressor NrdR [Candidatus Microgenomates bacterium]|nr:transcriptional repressor NrdR [Candidatus Microgenomates bacterium]
MNCPYCGSEKNEVTDSRANGGEVRRRRKCESCSGRFNTVETVSTDIEGRVVVHPGGKREKFDAEKLGQSIREATEGRLAAEETNEVIERAKGDFLSGGRREIPVSVIVDTVTSLLEGRDWLAPFRYAIYHSQNPEGVIDRWLKAGSEGGKVNQFQLPLSPEFEIHSVQGKERHG